MSDHEGVKLFGYWSSPYSRRVEIALKMKGVEYEYIEEDLSNKSPLLLEYNPVHKRVPVLLHNGKPIAESLVILEYIDETWKSGPPILPKDPYQRARARFWAKFIDDKFLVALRKIRMSKSEEEAEKAIEEASDLLKTLENELKDNKFFGGESINLIDIAAVYVALWLGVIQEITGVQNLYTKEKFPRLSEWINEFLNCSIIKEKLPPRAELLARLRPRSSIYALASKTK